MENAFIPMLFRMKHITRWGLMHSTQPESLSLHSLECAFLTHFLAVIGNRHLNGNYDADKLMAYAIYHDAAEILTGDLPTPIKYFNSEILGAYKGIEKAAAEKLLEGLPQEIRGEYAPYLSQTGLNDDEMKLIKASDKLCAYIKCINETGAGNREFESPLKACEEKIKVLALECPELDYFIKHFLDAFSSSLDDLQSTF